MAKDIRSGAFGHVGAGFAGHGHLPGLVRVLVLLMAASLRHQAPPIVLEQSHELPRSGSPLLPRFSNGSTGEERQMFAVILWLELGWHAGVLELISEAALGVVVIGGGGGGRLVEGVRAVAGRLRRGRVRPVAA